MYITKLHSSIACEKLDQLNNVSWHYGNLLFHKITSKERSSDSLNSKILRSEKDLYVYVKTTYSMQKYNVGGLCTVEEARRSFDNVVENSSAEDLKGYYGVFSIVEKKYIPLGLVHIYGLNSDDRISFAFWVLPKYQGQGNGTKIVKALIDKFRGSGYSILDVMVDVNNVASNKAMLNCKLKLTESHVLLRGIIANKYELTL